MTSKAITATSDTPLDELAALMETNLITRMPIVRRTIETSCLRYSRASLGS